MSASLQWQILRNFNKFNVKNPCGERAVFSKERCNIMKVNSPKYSGVANAKAIGVEQNADGNVVLVTKTKHALSSPNKAYNTVTFSRGARRTKKAIGNTVRNYRGDLRRVARARASAILLTKKAKQPKTSKGRRARSVRKQKKYSPVCTRDGANIAALPVDAAWHGFQRHLNHATDIALDLFLRDRRKLDRGTSALLERAFQMRKQAIEPMPSSLQQSPLSFKPYVDQLSLPPGDYDITFTDKATGEIHAFRLIMGPQQNCSLLPMFNSSSRTARKQVLRT
eukprot:gene9540-1770_t